MIADTTALNPALFGRFTLDAIPTHEPIVMGTLAAVVLLGVVVVAGLTYYRLWGYLWSEWFTSVDHKKIGIMYLVLAIVMLVRGLADAVMMRLQHAMAAGGHEGYLPAEHYDQIFTAHGVIMIFFVAMPLIAGFMNYLVPLQIGARDVAFPYINNLGFWLTTAGALLVNISLFVGKFADTGWTSAPPYSGIVANPGVGVDYYLWALQVSGVGTILSGINLLATIVKMRAPGMTLMRMPIFTWTSFCSNILIVASFPFLTIVVTLLTLDRYLGTHIFTSDLGGNPMLYVNIIWIWGHPEVYILILPLFGVFAEIAATFSGKRLFGYTSMVYATIAITILAYIVWLHHFFTMGAGETVNAVFGLATMLISIPTGVKVFNWLFTMYKGRVRFELPMMWMVAMLLTFVIGGVSGVLCAIPPSDFLLHNSMFLVAHFHNVIIGCIVFGVFAAFNYWFPKAFGFRLDEFWGRVSFWGWVVGYWVAWTPMYVVGLMGITRRLRVVTDPATQIWFDIALFGTVLIVIGTLAFVVQVFVSILKRNEYRDSTGDIWNARTLEWATSSPPPDYNFAFTPVIHDVDAWWDMKTRGYRRPVEGFKAIHMPRNTGTGVMVGGLSLVFCFAMVWYIWWLAIASFALLLIVGIGHTFNFNRDFHIPADDVVRTEGERTRLLAMQG